MNETATETRSVVAKRTSKKSAKVAKKAAAKGVAARAAKPRKAQQHTGTERHARNTGPLSMKRPAAQQ